MISVMDHTPGQRQWENIDHAWIYFSGKKGWSREKFEARVAQAREDQVRYAQPHRAYFTAYCKEHGIALDGKDRVWVRQIEYADATQLVDKLMGVFGPQGSAKGTTRRTPTRAPTP